MKQVVIILVILFTTVFLSAQEDNRSTITVLDFDVSGISESEQRVFNDYLTSAIVKHKNTGS